MALRRDLLSSCSPTRPKGRRFLHGDTEKKKNYPEHDCKVL